MDGSDGRTGALSQGRKRSDSSRKVYNQAYEIRLMLTEEKKQRLKKIFKELEGGIDYDGTACDLIKELRKTGFSKEI